MIFNVKDLIHIDMHDKISLAIIEVVTERLIHCRRLEDDEWFAFFDSTYDSVVRNFGQLSLVEFEEKYPEMLI